MTITQGTLFKRAIQISLVLHLGLIAFVLLKSILLPDAPKEFLPSLRVDLVALPDLKKSETALPAAPAPAEPAPPAPEKKESVATPKKAESAPEIERGDYSVAKRKQKHKEKSKKEKDARKKLKQALDRIRAIERIKALAGGEEVKGNQISKGSSLSGEAKQALESSYFDVVLERVRTFWELPKWLQDQNRSAKVMIFLDSQGKLKTLQMIQSSGNPAFDSEVKRTLQAAAPFPVPPSAIAGEIGKQGILLGFPL